MTPSTAADDDESVSVRSTGCESTNNALKVITRQPFDPISIAEEGPKEPPSVSTLSSPTPLTKLSRFQEQAIEEPQRIGPTMEDRMKQFFEGEDTADYDNPLNYCFLVDGTCALYILRFGCKVDVL